MMDRMMSCDQRDRLLSLSTGHGGTEPSPSLPPPSGTLSPKSSVTAANFHRSNHKSKPTCSKLLLMCDCVLSALLFAFIVCFYCNFSSFYCIAFRIFRLSILKSAIEM